VFVIDFPQRTAVRHKIDRTTCIAPLVSRCKHFKIWVAQKKGGSSICGGTLISEISPTGGSVPGTVIEFSYSFSN
jgi:hypothetical protein